MQLLRSINCFINKLSKGDKRGKQVVREEWQSYRILACSKSNLQIVRLQLLCFCNLSYFRLG